MSKYKRQSHVVWKCDYHIVWCPKYCFRILTGIVKDLVEHDIHSAKGFSVRIDGNLERKTGNKAIQELSPIKKETLLG